LQRICATGGAYHSAQRFFGACQTRNGGSGWQTFAKMCPEIGIEKKSFSEQHKSHINKVMGHATVAHLFWDSPKNRDKGLIIGLHRFQNYKVVARTTSETTKDPLTGKLKRKGNPI
jgi:hypothetical protein